MTLLCIHGRPLLAKQLFVMTITKLRLQPYIRTLVEAVACFRGTRSSPAASWRPLAKCLASPTDASVEFPVPVP
ncbi:hypothetical protein [Xenorhabdus anantnagensis]|uniref:Transposase n=1 Tax=Xenorhabdus anantnagensis TaxID=3025875 RepID=A0ABT5LPA1_9GAMM|nr:hypothetical protein [Xenorhabdus anantnagensis]MDC9595581.1 hypothetical protein [Xenorhabdus anantnagensis]